MSYDNYAIRFVFLAYHLSGPICDKQYRTCFVLFYLKIACFQLMTAVLIRSMLENILLLRLRAEKQHDAILGK